MNTTETIEKLPHETVLAELCFLETVEENPTTKAALNQAITLLQNKEKDTERLDWLENHEFTLSKNAPSGFLGCVKIPVTEYSNMHSTSVREMLDRCLSEDWQTDATKIKRSAIAAQQEEESV